MADKPSVLFVCVHNAGRSQMAALHGPLSRGGRRPLSRFGTSGPGQPAAVAAMAEVGIDIATEQPKILTAEAVKTDVAITTGRRDTCRRPRQAL